MIVISVILLITMSTLCYKMIAGVPRSEGAPLLRNGEPAELLDKAERSLAKGDAETAITTIETLAAKYPDSPHAEVGYFLAVSVYEKRGNFLEAKEICQKIVEQFPGSNNVLKAQDMLEDLNIRIFFSPVVTKDFFVYEVQKGDSLTRIAKKFNTTIEFVTRANEIRNDVLISGKKLKIPRMRFSIVIDKSQNILTLKSAGEIIKTYRVSTGKNSSTPVGTFKITNKIVDPPWYPPTGGVIPPQDSRNVLGSRWLGLSKPSYGIHGTIDPQSIGTSVTEGCVRMKNKDVEELFAIVPEGTEVMIVE